MRCDLPDYFTVDRSHLASFSIAFFVDRKELSRPCHMVDLITEITLNIQRAPSHYWIAMRMPVF